MNKNIVMLISLLTYCGSSIAQETHKELLTQTTDSASQQVRYYIAVRPMIAVAAFQSKDFIQNLENITDESIANMQWGVQIQVGICAHNRWNTGVEFNVLSTTNTVHKYPIYKYNSLYGGIYEMYDIVKRPNFILAGKIALGVGASSFMYSKDVQKDELPIEDFLNQPMSNGFAITQKTLGYASVGLYADWVIWDELRLGGYVEWTQQIGYGKWYSANAKTLISNLPKSSFTPLHVGLSIAFLF